MLCLNISIVLSFIGICLNFMDSSADDKMHLTEKYKQRVRFNDLYAEYLPVIKYNYMCNRPREERVEFCKTVIRELRFQTEVNIYMNYLAFIEQEPCTHVKVWINEGNLLAHQTALNCFGRPLIPALEWSEEMVYFYQRIVIYPHNFKYMWVIEYNENEDYYVIRKFYKIKWTRMLESTIARNRLFSIPTPQASRNTSNLFTILYPIHQQLIHYSNPTENPRNIVHSSNNSCHYKICYLVFRYENYKKKSDFDTSKPAPKKLQATLRGPTDDLPVSLIAYNCNFSVSEDKTFMSKYSIAAGPGDHSVILLKDVNSDNKKNPHYLIIQLVEYVTVRYISAYFNSFY